MHTEDRKPKTDERAAAVGVVVLAAGAAHRMGAPKQLLEIDGRSLLRRAVETALAAGFRPVAVVLGAHAAATRGEISELPVEIVINEDWASGLSSSIRAGVERILALAPETAAVVIALADQPDVTARHLALLAEKFAATGRPVVAARYDETIGVPALFARETFAELAALEGDKGAKALISRHRANLATIDLPEAARDIDTPADFERWRSEAERDRLDGPAAPESQVG